MPRLAGFYPFWFWNDDLQEDEIRRQINCMAEQGIRGFYIHPRQGLRTPYLSDRFFLMVGVALEAAEMHGMQVCLYDEYPYPSGPAGGEALVGRPQHHATRLDQTTLDVPGGHVRIELPRGAVLNCTAVPLRDGEPVWEEARDLTDHVGMVLVEETYYEAGLTPYTYQRYFAATPTPTLEADLPERPHRIFASVQVEVTHYKYWDHFLDTMSPEAVREFMRLTHERYRARFSEHFGGLIPAIFTDEASPRWSDRVPGEFARRNGYELPPVLHALQDESHPRHVEVAGDLWDTQYALFCEAWEEQYAGWCEENELLYATEKAVWRMSQHRYAGIPGGDPGHTKAGAPMDLLQPHLRQNAVAAASGAYFYDKPVALAECYHSLGWSGTLQDAKTIAEGLLLLGVTHLVPHGFFYTTHSLAKHDAAPSFFFQMPYWQHFGRLSERVEQIAALTEGVPDARVLVVDPNPGLPTQEQAEDFARLQQVLMGQHIGFLLVDVDILEEADRADGRLCVKDIRADAVVVPPMRRTEGALADWLAASEEAGGAVIRVEDGFDEGHLRAALSKVTAPTLSVREDGQEVKDIWVSCRDTEEGVRWFVLNTGADSHELTLWPRSGGLREIPLEDTLGPRLRAEGEEFVRAVAPFESFVVEATQGEVPLLDPLGRLEVTLGGPAQVRPVNANLLRLAEWTMSLPDGQSATVSSMPVCDQLERGDFAFKPRHHKFFGHPSEWSLPELTLTYESCFDCDYEGVAELVMEPRSLRGEWTVRVNDAGYTREDFEPTDSHVRGSLAVDVSDVLKPGANSVRIELTTERPDGGLVNPLYLAGDFGVALDPPRLVDPLREGSFEDYEGNRLPFYAGVVEYETDFDLPDLPDGGEVVLEFTSEQPFHEACEVSINGGPSRPLLWEPRLLRVASERLDTAGNRLVIRVHTTLIRPFEGRWFDYEALRPRDIEAAR